MPNSPRSFDSLPDDVDRSLFEPNDGFANGNPNDVSFRQLVREDYLTHGKDLFSQGFWTLFWHRFGNCIRDVRPRLVRMPLTLSYKVAFKVGQWTTGILLPYTVRVGRRVRLEHFGGMILVPQAIGNDVVIRQNTTMGISRDDRLFERPVIGNNVSIGAGAVIVGPIWVGDGAVVAANAVVVRHVPPRTVVGGVPAQKIGNVEHASQGERYRC